MYVHYEKNIYCCNWFDLVSRRVEREGGRGRLEGGTGISKERDFERESQRGWEKERRERKETGKERFRKRIREDERKRKWERGERQR